MEATAQSWPFEKMARAVATGRSFSADFPVSPSPLDSFEKEQSGTGFGKARPAIQASARIGAGRLATGSCKRSRIGIFSTYFSPVVQSPILDLSFIPERELMEILLIPGFMLGADLWREMRPALEQYGRIADVDTSQDDSVEAMAERAVSALTGPAVVIGFSMGGYVARAMTYRAPDKVRGLALVATSSRGSTGSPGTEAMPRFQRLGRTAVTTSLHPDHRSDDVIGRVQQMSARLGNDVFQRQSRMVRHDDTDRIRVIGCPTAVIAGAQDELRSFAESEALHEGIAGSTLTVIDHSGHLIPIEQPDALMRALRPLLEEVTH